ncbi:hypothetical protein F3D3_2919 [Fusibacter sp. 3D3]|nr:hypothetical protein F3D3_2919 [Fusibacter sp. 3D3]
MQFEVGVHMKHLCFLKFFLRLKYLRVWRDLTSQWMKKKYLSQGKGIFKKSVTEQNQLIDKCVDKVVVFDDRIEIYLFMEHYNKV